MGRTSNAAVSLRGKEKWRFPSEGSFMEESFSFTDANLIFTDWVILDRAHIPG